MKTEIIFAGFGGQGILLMGKTIGQSAMSEGKYVTYLPSYGPEMRSGTSNCSVIISDQPIASPVISSIDVLVAMNQPSYLKFAPRIRPEGVLVYNDTLVTPDDSTAAGVRCAGGAFTGQAGELGNVRVCSMVALGRLIREVPLVALETAVREMKKLTAKRSEFAVINEKAMLLGYES
jgi:2-oxoglutarate ferredoxin oxidoreductase subunit gamma